MISLKRTALSLKVECLLQVISEYRLFELVLQWIDYKREERQAFLPQLVCNLRLPLLSGEELVDKVSQVNTLICLSLMCLVYA